MRHTMVSAVLLSTYRHRPTMPAHAQYVSMPRILRKATDNSPDVRIYQQRRTIREPCTHYVSVGTHEGGMYTLSPLYCVSTSDVSDIVAFCKANGYV